MENYFALNWQKPVEINRVNYTCGHCGVNVAPSRGYHSDSKHIGGKYIMLYFAICSNCNRGSFLSVFTNTYDTKEQYPSPVYGEFIKNLNPDVEKLYNQARNAMSVNSYTSAVLTCRKILMHVAVDKGASEDLNFYNYVKYLDDKQYISEDNKEWVDYIRKVANQENHEIKIMEIEEAKNVISFTEMLLKVMYEYPAKIQSINPEILTEGQEE